MNGIGRHIQHLSLRLIYAAWWRRYLIVLPILIMPFVGFAAGKLVPKTYTSTMTMLVQEPASINPFLEDLAIETGLAERMQALLEQMRTRTTLSDVASDLGWISPASSPDQVNAALQRLRTQTRIRLVGQEVVEVAYFDGTPQGMALVVNAVAQRFVDHLLAPAQSSVEASERFLGEELERFTEELNAAELRLAAFKSANAEALPELHMQNVQALADVRQRLSTLRSERSGQEARLGSSTLRVTQTNPILGSIDTRIAALQVELADLLVRYTDAHSEVRRVRDEIEVLRLRRAEIEQESIAAVGADPERLWNMLSSDSPETRSLIQDQLANLEQGRNSLVRLDREIETLEAQEAELAERVRRYADVEREIVTLERDVEVKRTLMEQLSERYEMAKVTGSLGRQTTPDLIRIIDQPRDPSAPNTMSLIFYVIAGLFGGIAIGCGLAFAAELLDTTITRPGVIAELVALPVISRIPYVPPDERTGMTALEAV